MNRWLAACLSLPLALSACTISVEDGASRDNEEIVRRFVSAVNDRDLDALDELVASDVIRHSPSTPGLVVTNREELKDFLRQDFATVPNSVQEIQSLVSEGDRVAVWVTYSGNQEGPWGPYPATGRPLELEFAGFLRIHDGKIAEMRVVWDNLSALTQLGHMEPPGS